MPVDARFLAVGQLTVDTTVGLHAPLAAGDQTTGSIRRGAGGSAAIAAHNAAGLELCRVAFAGHCGADAAGDAALEVLRDAGVGIAGLVRTGASPEVVVLVGVRGERTMVAAPGSPPWHRLDLDVAPGDVVLFEGWHLFGGGDERYDELIVAARRRGATVALDVCSASRAADPRAHARRLAALAPDILLANAAEAATLDVEADPPAATVVVHAGGDPTRLWRGGRCTTHAVARREPVDTTGAGDTFAGALLAARAAGMEWEYAIEIAHETAGAVVGREGALLRSQAFAGR